MVARIRHPDPQDDRRRRDSLRRTAAPRDRGAAGRARGHHDRGHRLDRRRPVQSSPAQPSVAHVTVDEPLGGGEGPMATAIHSSTVCLAIMLLGGGCDAAFDEDEEIGTIHQELCGRTPLPSPPALGESWHGAADTAIQTRSILRARPARRRPSGRFRTLRGSRTQSLRRSQGTSSTS